MEFSVHTAPFLLEQKNLDGLQSTVMNQIRQAAGASAIEWLATDGTVCELMAFGSLFQGN